MKKNSLRPTAPIQLGINLVTQEPYRVFLVEDSITARTFLRRILTGNGFKICGEAENGQMALDALAGMSVAPDIFCVDQDMPKMDGVTFIKNARVKCPTSKIVMITARADKAFIQEIVNVKVHAYVMKPILPKVLTEKLASVLGRKDLAENSTAFRTTSVDLSKMIIPSMPDIVLKVAQFDIEDLDRGIRELEEIVKPDIGIVSQILKVSNSSFYGLSKKVTTIKEAITILGIKMVKNIVLVSYKQALNKNLKNPLFILHLRKLPVLSSLIAFDLVKPLNVEHLQKNIFLITLLRQIGMNILCSNFSAQYLKILKLYQFHLKSLFELEREEFNTTSIEIGEKVFKLWNMPETYITTITNQNFSLIELEHVSDSDRIARLADVLSKEMLEIPLQDNERILAESIFDYYRASKETREIFGASYMDLIKDHPFFTLLNNS